MYRRGGIVLFRILAVLQSGIAGESPAMNIVKVVLVLLIFTSASLAAAAEKQILFREDFRSLDNWEPLFFPKIKKHSTYTIESVGKRSFLKAESQASASAIVHKKAFNVYEYPRARWRWRVDNVYTQGTPRDKAGDDYPIRVYVMFQYDPQNAELTEKVSYGIAKTIYGKYPPHSTMNYVWTGHEIPERIITSPYTDKAKMIILEQGRNKVGMWVEETVNILEDYRKAFGKDPPATAGIAVMNDSDNTGESAVSYIEYIEVFK